ncbi:HAD-IA family hydrolase [Candidatus Pacearchaeota archaeon]|nr:HAD-IA family hydrolase [Candidatus Pacearchaeota archaeon]
MANIEALITDIGNVIYPERWDLVLEKVGDINNKITFEQFLDAYSKEWEQYRVDKINSDEYWKNVAKELGFEESAGKKLSVAFTNIWHDSDEDLCNFLLNLNGKFKIYALSNSCPENEDRIKEDIINGKLRFINRFYLSHKEQIAKPDEAAYRNVLNTNNFDAEKCIYVDDKERNLIPARKIGMHAVLYKNFEYFKEQFEGIIEL